MLILTVDTTLGSSMECNVHDACALAKLLGLGYVQFKLNDFRVTCRARWATAIRDHSTDMYLFDWSTGDFKKVERSNAINETP